jgi:hypothetical protein
MKKLRILGILGAALLAVALLFSATLSADTENRNLSFQPTGGVIINPQFLNSVYFSVDNTNWSTLGDLVPFVNANIRPKLSKTGSPITVYISYRILGKEQSHSTITVDPSNYYVTQINGQTLPSEVESYNNRLAVDISFFTVVDVVRNTNNYQYNGPTTTTTYNGCVTLYNKQRIAKVYAFLFGESARFNDVETALNTVLSSNKIIEWHEFDALVHNWSNISTYVIGTGTVEPGQIKCGNLLSAVSTAQVKAFVNAISQTGSTYKFSTGAAPFPATYVYTAPAP